LWLNPAAVFVGVPSYYGLRGVSGAFLAVPILASLEILGHHIESLSPVAELPGS
jgi:predicted PurR-regulated permease PerM